tara:strand:- start:1074 stop:2036 length:963 start_codon:yes stop_codon:yes gene_type:complete
MSNILVLSAGRRVALVSSFKKELIKYCPSSNIFTCDINPHLSSACQFSDRSFSIPHCTDATYIESLTQICVEHNVSLVIPTIDTELSVLSSLELQSLPFKVLISSQDFIDLCSDKRLTSKYFSSIGVSSPLIYSSDRISYPCFVKPYNGSSSVRSYLFDSQSNVPPSIFSDSSLIFCEFINSSYDEYSVDAYFDRIGNLICFVPRQRLAVRAGEVSKSVTARGILYDLLLPIMRNVRGAYGPITFQFFFNPSNNDIKALEINARFGGGFPLSYDAGANFPAMIINEYLLNKSLEFFDAWTDNLLMLRYDAHILKQLCDSD